MAKVVESLLNHFKDASLNIEAQLAEVSAAIGRLEAAEFEARRELATVANERESLLDRDDVFDADFVELNLRRDRAQLAIDRALKAIPRLRLRERRLTDEVHTARAEAGRAELRAAAAKIESATGFLFQANADARAIYERVAASLPSPGKFGLERVEFQNTATEAGLETWRSFIALNVAPRPAAAAQPAPKLAGPDPRQAPAPTPDVNGRVKIFLLTRRGANQAGDTILLAAAEAEKLVRAGGAEFVDAPAGEASE
ncbi:hypothetical protein [Methylocapsa acidiphila]|uniref:hypothetical protein n=1 Tax=Methylocapsa acidiphila TaxID=133552 RepID=UPI0003FF4D22|nr:hypothetical protein [Methylocapsa acidiphila]